MSDESVVLESDRRSVFTLTDIQSATELPQYKWNEVEEYWRKVKTGTITGHEEKMP